MSSSVNVPGGDIAQPFVITSVVIVFDEGSDRFLQFTRHLVGQMVNLPFKRAVISFNLAVGLRMERRGGNVPYPHQSQVLVELLGNVPCPIIGEQHRPVLQRHARHAGKIYRPVVPRLRGIPRSCLS